MNKYAHKCIIPANVDKQQWVLFNGKVNQKKHIGHF